MGHATNVDPNYTAPYVGDFPPPTSAPYIPPTVGNPVTSIPQTAFFPAPVIVRTRQETCNHCWCERSPYKTDHARCCKCADTMHDKFCASSEFGRSE